MDPVWPLWRVHREVTLPRAERRPEEHQEGTHDSPGPDKTGASESSTMEAERHSEHLEKLFASLYPQAADENGVMESRKERLSKGYGSISLTYGEVSPRGVSAAFLSCSPCIRPADRARASCLGHLSTPAPQRGAVLPSP